jgi:hypothetical protein
MRINGEWYPCNDGIIRPTVVGRVRTGERRWRQVRFLVDSGADWTMFSLDVVRRLRTTLEPADFGIAGIGGTHDVSAISTLIRFPCEGGVPATFRGKFAAATEEGALDMSVLARDKLNNFAVILDKQNDLVVLINQRHRYSIAFE